MRKINFLAILVLASSVTCVSCKKDKPIPEPEKPTVVGKIYVGTATLTMDQSPTSLENIETEIIETNYPDTVQLILKGIQFTPAMPKIDITIPSVFAERATDINTPNAYILSGNNIIPTAMGGIPAPDPFKPINDLQGVVTETSLSVSMTVGTLTLSYDGTIKE
ncbi:MAG: hypothetical protein LBT04_07935 [Prevotellaceae bacterium]|jgi:hypothetical protein|nr:hypothetical protein [Prevotellaceae bacterium]